MYLRPREKTRAPGPPSGTPWHPFWLVSTPRAPSVAPGGPTWPSQDATFFLEGTQKAPKSHLKGGPGSSSPIQRAAICMHRRGAFVTVAKLEKKGVWQNNFFFKIAASCSNTTPVHKKGGPKGCRAQHGTPCWGRLWG